MRNKLLTIVGVIAVFAMTGITSAQNLLADGDFEEANAYSDWTTWSWNAGFSSVTIDVNRDGNYGSWTNGGNGTYLLNCGNAWYDGGGGAFQTVPVTAGLDYQLSVDCGAADWWLPTGQMALIWMDSSETNAIGTNSIFTVDPAVYGPNYDVPHPMATYSMTETAPPGTAFVKVEFQSFMPGGTGGSLTFDNALLLQYDPIADADSDGLPDAWELSYGLDPNDATGANGASGDPDSDGLVNSGEFANGSSPILTDTDGDGLDDNDEITYSTDPADSDTDGDSLSDGNEVHIHGTDPTLADTDVDGENDDLELFQGTNPNDAASSSAALGIPIVDGTLDAALYGAPFAVQTSQTSGSDALGGTGSNYVSGTELDAIYSVTVGNKLYLMVTGNVSNNWGNIDIYVDSTTAISNNVLDSLGVNPDPVGEIAAQSGITFDAGFSPDYLLHARGSYGVGWDNFYISHIDLNTKTMTEYVQPTTNEMMSVNYRTGTGQNAHSIGVALDNSNTNGVVSGTGAADQVAAAAVTTGLEISINLADLGSPVGEVRIAVIAADQGNNVLLNQVLPGVTPQIALGAAGAVDFVSQSGDQYVMVLDASLDTDADGMPDLWEQSFGLDPNDATGVNGAAGDPDADGLVNIDELNENTSPKNPDMDDDGLSDGLEVNTYSTLPKDSDTDDDGLSDGDEVNIHGTNPLLVDSDADTEDDWYELFQGTDPTDAASSSAALGLVVIDGTLDVSAYSDAVAVQTVNTAWTNDMDELDAAYARVQKGRLCLMLTGNLNVNWNSIELFIDSSDAVTTNVLTAQGRDQTDSMDGLVFDTGFSPDYHLNIRMGTWDANTNELGAPLYSLNVDFAQLGTNAAVSWRDGFINSNATSLVGNEYMAVGDANPNGPIAVGINNSNVAGVIGDPAGGLANQAAALAVSTGIELSISMADLGNPTGEIRVMAMVTGNETVVTDGVTNVVDHIISGNQVLPGLPAPQVALGATSNLNFTAIAGDQFFIIPLAGKAHIMSGQMIAGDTLMALNVGQLVHNFEYIVQETDDLEAGFTDVPGSEWTATGASDVRAVPVNPGANPVMFYQVVAP